ncbi:MAG: reverse transcriptase domain-containing protein [Candidatus Thiodiazotropha sp.]
MSHFIKLIIYLICILLFLSLCNMKDNLRTNLTTWKTIGTSDTVLDWIKYGVRFPLIQDVQEFEFSNQTFSKKEEVFLENEISELLLLGCIDIATSKPKCVSPISCVPKKNGKLRLVTDLRHLNSYTSPPKVKYEDINTVIKVVKPKDFMITTDLQNGFFHTPVHTEHQTLLGFKFKSVYYTWSVLPFGHNCSPFYFTKTLRPVVTYLRCLGLRIVLYVDDFILFATSDNIKQHTQKLLSILQQLGWVNNLEKSSLEPELQKEFIGYSIDNNSENTIIKIPQQRITKLRKDIGRCLRKGKTSARSLARIGGQCVSMYKCIFPAKLQLRNLYRLLASRTSWSDTLILDTATIEDLVWWKTSLSQWNGLVVQDFHIDIKMTTDASVIAWGAWIPGHNAQGFWNKQMSHRSSNYREMSAVWLGLISLRHFLQNKTIQICSDNISTIAFINHMGGASKELDSMARLIHQQALDMNAKIVASYVSGERNWRADQLSRLNSTYEWRLHPQIFQLIDRYWGPHDIDRFASMMTTQLATYNSLYWDPYTSGVNALAQKNWMLLNNFVNAPFSLLPQVLDIIEQQKATATVIAPLWESQVWFHKLKSLLIDHPIPLPMSTRTVLRVGPRAEPLKNGKWRLFAWRLCGRRASDV